MGAEQIVRKSVSLTGYDYSRNHERYKGLIKSLAYKAYQKISHVSMVELDDLVNDGHIYMMQISEKFDRTRGVKFSTFMTDALSKFFINSIKYHYRDCRKGNLNTYDIDDYTPRIEKDYHLVYEMTDDGIEEEDKYSQLIHVISDYIEEKDLPVYNLMSQGLARKEIMDQLAIKPWTYNNSRKRIQDAIAPLVGR